MKLRTKDIPALKQQLLNQQGYICPLCRINMKELPSRDVCLDHDHKTGFVRSVLCRNCNTCEGKVTNVANRAKRTGESIEWLKRYVEYVYHHPHTTFIHPAFKTPEEKKLLQKKRRKRKKK